MCRFKRDILEPKTFTRQTTIFQVKSIFPDDNLVSNNVAKTNVPCWRKQKKKKSAARHQRIYLINVLRLLRSHDAHRFKEASTNTK